MRSKKLNQLRPPGSGTDCVAMGTLTQSASTFMSWIPLSKRNPLGTIIAVSLISEILVWKPQFTSANYCLSGIKKLGVLNPDLDAIEKARIPVRLGHDKEKYYEVHYQIQATYFSAHCEYTLWYEDKEHGTVRFDYA